MPVHLVLHGGSGVHPEMIQSAVRLPGGGIGKVDIATDLEHALMNALERTERFTGAKARELPSEARHPLEDRKDVSSFPAAVSASLGADVLAAF